MSQTATAVDTANYFIWATISLYLLIGLSGIIWAIRNGYKERENEHKLFDRDHHV